jgi:hypothetical protein
LPRPSITLMGGSGTETAHFLFFRLRNKITRSLDPDYSTRRVLGKDQRRRIR